MDGMTSGGKMLAQDDIDALLNEAGLDGGYSEESAETPEPAPEPVFNQKTRSEEDVVEILADLYCKASLKREKGVQVIWNAMGVLPMNAGMTMKIQGKDYMSLGVLNKNHLIVGSSG